jgi:hypothetical protein
MQFTHSVNAPGFNPCTGNVISVISWLQSLLFKCKLYRYATARQLAVIDEGLSHWSGNVQLLHARALSLKTAGDLDGARAALVRLDTTTLHSRYIAVKTRFN